MEMPYGEPFTFQFLNYHGRGLLWWKHTTSPIVESRMTIVRSTASGTRI